MNTLQTTEIRLNAGQLILVQQYARLKRAEKRLSDLIAKAKGRVLGIAPITEDKIVLLSPDGQHKVASISLQSRASLDVERLQRDHPELNLETYKMLGEPFPVIRLH